MQGITGLGHAAIRVADTERTLAFYVGKLGFDEMMRLDDDDGGLMLIYLRITDDQYLEIFPDAEGTHAPDPQANGLNHFCLTVDDLDAVVERLRSNGILPTIEPKTGLDGNRQAWIADPDGNRIELMQMNPEGMQARAIAEMRGH
ncbi:VOC family protein [Pararhizobium mangrovi]|uniref:VOC family protein n=1 Tax=Pararhizobium mangrovi TaxID=2590452 RepID=A0A506TZ81_9HYPH|nr:VOC family protein [Pararhizobium mangrovi]TPW26508.1 VOC family protein [Pararhizobium mangrovi]